MRDRAGTGRGAERGSEPVVYVVIVADPVTGEVDAFGPFDEVLVGSEVARRRTELDAENLRDVVVTPVVLSPPAR